MISFKTDVRHLYILHRTHSLCRINALGELSGVFMSPVSLVFHTIVTVKSISKMHLKQTHPFYSIIGSKNYWLGIIATISEHLPCRSFGYFRLDYQGLGKACRRSVWAYLPVKHTRCQYFCKFKACLKGS